MKKYLVTFPAIYIMALALMFIVNGTFQYISNGNFFNMSIVILTVRLLFSLLIAIQVYPLFKKYRDNG